MQSFFQEQMILFSDILRSLQQMLSRTFKLHNPDSLGQLHTVDNYGQLWTTNCTLWTTTMCEYPWSCKVCLVHTWANTHDGYCKYFDLHTMHSLLGSHLGRLWNLQPAISHTLCLNVVDDFVVGLCGRFSDRSHLITLLVRYYFHISSTHFHFFIIRYSFILFLLSPLAQWQCWRGIIFYVCPGRVYTSTYSSILSHPLLSEHIGGNLWPAVDWDMTFWDKFGKFFDIFWPIWQFFSTNLTLVDNLDNFSQ